MSRLAAACEGSPVHGPHSRRKPCLAHPLTGTAASRRTGPALGHRQHRAQPCRPQPCRVPCLGTADTEGGTQEPQHTRCTQCPHRTSCTSGHHTGWLLGVLHDARHECLVCMHVLCHDVPCSAMMYPASACSNTAMLCPWHHPHHCPPRYCPLLLLPPLPTVLLPVRACHRSCPGSMPP